MTPFQAVKYVHYHTMDVSEFRVLSSTLSLGKEKGLKPYNNNYMVKNESLPREVYERQTQSWLWEKIQFSPPLKH